MHIAQVALIGAIYGSSWFIAAVTAIDEHSLIPIGIAAGIAIFSGGILWKASAWKTEIEAEQKRARENSEAQTAEMKGIKGILQQLVNERRLDADTLRTEIILPKPPRNIVQNDGYIPTVLEIDDDPNDRFIVRRCLSAAGFKVLEASSLREARDILKDHSVDCCLLDLNLKSGGPTGAETVAAFVREYPSALCIALTGNEDPAVKSEALAAGADAFAFKMETADQDYLPKIIRTAMDRHAMKSKLL